METYDILILGKNSLNCLSIAADAATRGYRVKLLIPKSINGETTVISPVLVSGVFQHQQLNPFMLLKHLSELRILTQRTQDICQWLPAVIKMPKSRNNQPIGSLARMAYHKLYQWYKLPLPFFNKEPLDKTCRSTCVVDTQKLIAANNRLAQSFNTDIEEDIVIHAMNKISNDWEIHFENQQGLTRQIAAKTIINCMGRSVLDTSKHWLGYKSRCRITTGWQYLISFHTEQPINNVYYLTSQKKSHCLYCPVNSQQGIIQSFVQTGQNPRAQIEALLKYYKLPALEKTELINEWFQPYINLPQTIFNHTNSYMIDFICPQGSHPIVNVIGEDTVECRLLAEQAINNLIDYLPKAKPCQTKQLDLVSSF